MSYEEFARWLLGKGVCEKIARVEEGSECSLAYCRRSQGPDLLIAYAEAPPWVYCKAVPEPLVKPYMWHCNNIFLNPYGLYAFSRSDEALAEKLRAKQRLLNAQYRMAVERLGSAEA